MRLIEVDPKAVHVMEHCYGGYTTNISLADFVREENFLLIPYLVSRCPQNTVVRWLVVPHMLGRACGLMVWSF